MIHNHNSLPPIDPEHSVRLDVHTWSEHKEVNALRDAVWKEIPTQLQDALLGKSNNKGHKHSGIGSSRCEPVFFTNALVRSM